MDKGYISIVVVCIIKENGSMTNDMEMALLKLLIKLQREYGKGIIWY